MNRSLAWLAGLITVLAFLCMLLPALAHESWISDRGLKNGAGEWCCGDYDCKGYNEAASTAQGWVVDGELVPYDEAMPVAPPDARLTICRRPDGTRRCVFGLRPGF